MNFGAITVNDHTFEEETIEVKQLSDVLLRHIIPIFAEAPCGKPKLIGSSFLISSGKDSYLVSAAHVFDELKNNHELFYYVEPKTKRKLSGNLRLTKIPEGKNRKDDRIDVGVLKLEEPGLPPYPKVEKDALTINAFMTEALPRERKEYLLVGFPESKSRVNPIARDVASVPYGFRGISIPSQEYAKLSISPQSHIVLRFDRKHVIGYDGQIFTFPEPSGISGSPVWLLYDEHGLNDPNQTPIVGIAIEHHKTSHTIVATDIAIALRLINEIA